MGGTFLGFGTDCAPIVKWTGPDAGSWDNPANWTPARIPGPDDTALFYQNGAFTISIGSNVDVHRISVTAGVILFDASGRDIQVGRPLEVAANAYLGGAFVLRGDVQLSGTLYAERETAGTITFYADNGAVREYSPKGIIITGTLAAAFGSRLGVSVNGADDDEHSQFVVGAATGSVVMDVNRGIGDPPSGEYVPPAGFRTNLVQKYKMDTVLDPPLPAGFLRALTSTVVTDQDVFLVPVQVANPVKALNAMDWSPRRVELLAVGLPKRTDGTTLRVQGDATRLALSVHGWKGDTSRLFPRCQSMGLFAAQHGLASNWDITYLDWRPFCGDLFDSPDNASLLGAAIGDALYTWLFETGGLQRYQKYHLMGHSAGSWLIDRLADRIGRPASVQLTFFDSYNAPLAGLGARGESSNRVEHYVDDVLNNALSCGAANLLQYAWWDLAWWATTGGTAATIPTAINVDVTCAGPENLNPHLTFVDDPIGSLGHRWPEEWYQQTFPSGGQGADDSCAEAAAQGHYAWGFRQSLLYSEYRATISGCDCFDAFDNPVSCAGCRIYLPNHEWSCPSGVSPQTINLNQCPVTFGPTGTGQLTPDGGARLQTGSPIQMNATLPLAARSSGLRFTCQFVSATSDAHGLLTVRSGGNFLFAANEAALGSGPVTVDVPFPAALGPGQFDLEFLLDIPDSIQSTVLLSDFAVVPASPATLTIRQGPIPQTVDSGATLNLFVAADGPLPFQIRWMRSYGSEELADGPLPSGAVVTGSQTSHLQIVGMHLADGGGYAVRVYDGQSYNEVSAAVQVVCRADADGDYQVVPADVAFFVQTWLQGIQAGSLAGDFDRNGIVEPQDVALFVQDWFAAVVNGC